MKDQNSFLFLMALFTFSSPVLVRYVMFHNLLYVSAKKLVRIREAREGHHILLL